MSTVNHLQIVSILIICIHLKYKYFEIYLIIQLIFYFRLNGTQVHELALYQYNTIYS